MNMGKIGQNIENTKNRISQHITNAVKSNETKYCVLQLRMAARASVSLADQLIGMVVELEKSPCLCGSGKNYNECCKIKEENNG